MKNTFLLFFLFVLFNINGQITGNIATQYGNWNNCYTWSNTSFIYNSSSTTPTMPNSTESINSKTIANNIIVNLNLPIVYANKIYLNTDSKIILSGTNKISFTGSGTSINCSSSSDKIDEVTVKFNEPVVAKSLSGFLHGLTKPTPVNSDIAPLQPKLMRQSFKDKYERAYYLSGRVHMLLSDAWEFWDENYFDPNPNNGLTNDYISASRKYNFVPTDNPYVDIEYPSVPNNSFNGLSNYNNYLDNWFDWARIDQTINSVPQPISNQKPGIVWECWNEPDHKNYWKPNDTSTTKNNSQWYSPITDPNTNPATQTYDYTYWPIVKQQEFFQTYKLFYNKLRERLGPEALAAGPSMGTFNKEYIKNFFDFCLTNGLEVNVVTWHELNWKAKVPISEIAEHVEYVRTNFKDNPAYEALKIQSIEINEITHPVYKNNPAALASYIGYLEKARVDYAAKACWKDGTNTYYGSDPDADPLPLCNSCESCSSNTFNHLFTSDNEKKSNWWVYKLYADGVAGRVKSYNQNNKSVVISNKLNFTNVGSTPSPYAQVLFGYVKSETGLPTNTNGSYSIKLENLGIYTGVGLNNSSNISRVYDGIVVKRIPNNNPFNNSTQDENYENYLGNQNTALLNLEDLDDEFFSVNINSSDTITVTLNNPYDGYLYQIIVMAHYDF